MEPRGGTGDARSGDADLAAAPFLAPSAATDQESSANAVQDNAICWRSVYF